MRNGGTILELCTAIRKIVDHPSPRIKLEEKLDADGKGIYRRGVEYFNKQIDLALENGKLQDPKGAKIIAWRNATVDKYNKRVRTILWGAEATSPWASGDRFILTAPAKDFDDEIIGNTDDEGTIERVDEAPHPVYQDIRCLRLLAAFDWGSPKELWVLHPAWELAFRRQLATLADMARVTRKWDDYWAFKEAFHAVRHGYAITAHRSQGSTYSQAFVDCGDILLNPNRSEAMRCLYVPASRPRDQLFFP
jgi:exodeoxyribonuclease-5